MGLPWLIALRFLSRARRERALAIFTGVSITGVALAVAVFLLIQAVLGGFSQKFSELLRGFEAPLSAELSSRELGDFNKTWQDFVATHGGEQSFKIESAAEFFGLAQVGSESPTGIKVRTVDRDFLEQDSAGVTIYWADGFDPQKFLNDPSAALVGEKIYRTLPFVIDEPEVFHLIHPFAALGPTGELEPATRAFHVAGLVSTGYDDVDRLYVYLPPKALLGFADPGLLTQRVFITPKNIDSSATVLNEFRLFSNSQGAKLKSWTEKNQALFRAMKIERVAFFSLFTIVVIVSFFTLSHLIMLFVLSKIRDIGILRAAGLSPTKLSQTFFYLGTVLGAIGTALGAGLTMLLIGAVKVFELKLPDAYGFTELPLHLSPVLVLSVLLITPFLSGMVALISARKPVAVTVAEILRAT